MRGRDYENYLVDSEKNRIPNIPQYSLLESVLWGLPQQKALVILGNLLPRNNHSRDTPYKHYIS